MTTTPNVDPAPVLDGMGEDGMIDFRARLTKDEAALQID